MNDVVSPRRRAAVNALFGCLFLALGGCNANTTAIAHIPHRYSVQDPQFAQVMGNLLGPPLVPGNACVTLQNGEEIFPSMLQAIHSAKKSISFESFIYWSGSIGQEFTDALSDRAKAGVKVHVLIDWLGSSKINPTFLKQLKHCGVHVQLYHPINVWNPFTIRQLDNRTHRKILVVDGKIGFTGGVGIADEWSGHAQDPNHWRDNHYRIEGPIVANLQGAFMDNWIKMTNQVLVGSDYFPQLPTDGHLWAQIYKSGAGGGSESMQLMMALSIAAAEKKVRIESAYFVPDKFTIQLLLEARARGVEVDIIVPGPHIDETIVRNASRATWGSLLKAGAIIQEYQPTMFHCKLMVVDDLWVSIGSSNFDNRSFRLNDEANLNVLDPQFAAEQVRIFENDKRHARVVTYDQWMHRPAADKFNEFMASLFAWEL